MDHEARVLFPLFFWACVLLFLYTQYCHSYGTLSDLVCKSLTREAEQSPMRWSPRRKLCDSWEKEPGALNGLFQSPELVAVIRHKARHRPDLMDKIERMDLSGLLARHLPLSETSATDVEALQSNHLDVRLGRAGPENVSDFASLFWSVLPPNLFLVLILLKVCIFSYIALIEAYAFMVER